MSGAAGHTVIVGAGAAGDAAAIGLRKAGYEGAVTLIGREGDPPYERPHLSKQFLMGQSDMERVILRPPGEYQRQDINQLPGETVAGGRAADGVITLESGREIRFDRLVVATGSTPRMLPGVPEAENILTLRSLRDGIRLKEHVDRSQSVLVVGAGFIGAEVASSARTNGKNVLLVEAAPVPLERVLGRDIGEVYARMHRNHGVDLRLKTTVADWVVDDGRLRAVELSDSTRVEVDVALIAVGVTPNLELPRELGLPVSDQGVEVDETLRAMEGVYAVGDIAAHLHPVYGRRIRVEHWQVAQRQGTAAAAAIAGEPTPYAELPWFWSDQYDVNLQYVGHAAGFDRSVVRGDLNSGSFSAFYLKNGILDATLSVNDGKSGRFSRDLISNRISLGEEPLAQMADPESDLRALVRSLIEA